MTEPKALTERADKRNLWQLGIALFFLALAVVYAVGAYKLPPEAGYAGVGPRFAPAVVAVLLAVVGAWLLWQALRGGFRNFSDPTAGLSADLRGGAWVVAGVLAHATLITRVGFVLGAVILFTCVARGFGSRKPLRDAVLGALITLPVFWLFTQVLDLTLPSLINRWI
jgi:putative tricarboxylic transport membrane protein